MRYRLVALLLAACSRDDGPGLRASLFVPEADYIAGSAPRESGGPEIVSFTPAYAQQLGERPIYLRGKLGPSATAVMLGRVGDPGYFDLVAGLPDLEEPDYPSFDTRAELSDAADEDVVLWARAVDDDGRVGASREVTLLAEPSAPPVALAITLSWDAQADLDLHVLTPSGDELWWGDIRTSPNEAEPVGELTSDAQAGCVASSRRVERASYAETAPSGDFEVRVAVAALCGLRAVPFEVEVSIDGHRAHRVSGIGVPSDALLGVRAGGGVSALQFRLP